MGIENSNLTYNEILFRIPLKLQDRLPGSDPHLVFNFYFNLIECFDGGLSSKYETELRTHKGGNRDERGRKERKHGR